MDDATKEADAAKRRRTQALSNFTRTVNTLNGLLDNSAPLSLVNKQYEKLSNCWEILEKAQDSYVEIAPIDIMSDPGGLLLWISMGRHMILFF